VKEGERGGGRESRKKRGGESKREKGILL